MTKLNWTNAGLRQQDPARVQQTVDFSTPDPVIIGKTGTRNKKKKKKKKVKLTKALGQHPTVVYPIPRDKIPLIASIMRDMGRTFPKKSGRVKTELERLLVEGIILPDGKPNTQHKFIRSWSQRVEKAEIAADNALPVRGTVAVSSRVLRPQSSALATDTKAKLRK